MSKYVIKNCPRLQRTCAFNVCGNSYGSKYLCGDGRYECQDRTDCVIKRIVGKCMELYNMECKNRYKTNGYILAFDILKELDIEEVK